MSFNAASNTNISDSNDERYKAQLARRYAEAEALLQEQEEQERLECQTQKEAKLTEQKRLEEEIQRKQKEENAYQKEEERQRDLAHHLELDCIATVEQQWRKNWIKTFQMLSSPSSNKEINLLDYPSLTKRQCVWYLLKETLEARQ